MRYLVIVEQGAASYGAYVPDLPGCIAAGNTKQEALALMNKQTLQTIQPKTANTLQFSKLQAGEKLQIQELDNPFQLLY